MAKRKARKSKPRKKHHRTVRHRKKKSNLKRLEEYAEENIPKTAAFALLISLASLGVTTLLHAIQGIYLHLPNILTYFAFVFVGVFIIRYGHGRGKNQAFYSAVLAAFGYFLFYRVYNLFMFHDLWKTSPIVGDSFIAALINTVVIYLVYTLFLYTHKKEK